MAKPSKVALVLNQHDWAIKLAERRAEEIDVRPPVEESTHKGFIVKVPNGSDILAWLLDEVGRQEAELSAEAQCWQDHTTKKKLLNWLDNCNQIVENLTDCLGVANQLVHAGVKLPETLPWNENGSPDVGLGSLVEEALSEIVQAAETLSGESGETPTEG